MRCGQAAWWDCCQAGSCHMLNLSCSEHLQAATQSNEQPQVPRLTCGSSVMAAQSHSNHTGVNTWAIHNCYSIRCGWVAAGSKHRAAVRHGTACGPTDCTSTAVALANKASHGLIMACCSVRRMARGESVAMLLMRMVLLNSSFKS